MLRESTRFFVLSLLLSVLVQLSTQNLNKQSLLPGLGDELNFTHLHIPRYTSTPGGDASLCNCNGGPAESIQTITYHDAGNQKLVLCMCPNAVMSAQYMIEMMGRVPYAIRRYNRAMVSASANTCGGAGSSGDISYYCDRNMHISVFIHESAHSVDRGTSGTDAWRSAVQRDSCVPDPYANSNYADNFAQVTVLWTHLIGQRQYIDLGGKQYACMRNQLEQISGKLGAWRMQAPRSTLQAGQRLEQGEALTSPNGNYRLVLQDDGNLVLYASDKTEPANALWATSSSGKNPNRLEVHRDGNLVLYDEKNRSTWTSDTPSENADRGQFILQDDGNLVLYDNNHHAIWASHTCCFIAPRV